MRYSGACSSPTSTSASASSAAEQTSARWPRSSSLPRRELGMTYWLEKAETEMGELG